MTWQFCFSAGGGGESLYLFIVAQIMSYAPKKQHSLHPSWKGVLKFSYEHPVIFTCMLVSLRIQFDRAKRIQSLSWVRIQTIKLGDLWWWKIQCF